MDIRQRIPLPSLTSDGSEDLWPKGEYEHPPADSLYHDKLADLWMKETGTGEAISGQKYTFADLPRGYRVFVKKRKSAEIVDRYIFGHPKARFDSPNKFFVHFKWLMNDRRGSCSCLNCSAKPATNGIGVEVSAVRPRKSRNTLLESSRNIPHTPMAEYLDMFINSNRGLQRKDMDLAFDIMLRPGWQSASYWRADQVEDLSDRNQKRPSFEPRLGEIVLFCKNNAVWIDEETQKYRLYDSDLNTFGGFPEWKAGVVSVLPTMENVSLRDLSHPKLSDLRRHRGLYRVELLPDRQHKARTVQAIYVNLNHIKPFSMFREVLSGIDWDDWDRSIKIACKAMFSLAPVDYFRFVGVFPEAAFQCRGLWIGSEKVEVGDAVRLMPMATARKENPPIQDILVIRSINLHYQNLDKSESSRKVYFGIRGKTYTIRPPTEDAKPAIGSTSSEADLVAAGLPLSMRGFTWFALFSGQELETSPWDIVGRLYEREAMQLIINAPDFNVGYEGISEIRSWLKIKYLRRIGVHKDSGKVDAWARDVWYLDRFRMLKIETFRGEAVGTGRNREKRLLGRPFSLSPGRIKYLEDIQDIGYSEYGTISMIANGEFRFDGQNNGELNVVERMSVISDSQQEDGLEDEADELIRETLEGDVFGGGIQDSEQQSVVGASEDEGEEDVDDDDDEEEREEDASERGLSKFAGKESPPDTKRLRI